MVSLLFIAIMFYSLWNEMCDVSIFHQLLLHGNKKVDSIDDHLNEFNFREAKSISIGDVKDSILTCCVNASSSWKKLNEKMVIENYVKGFSS